MISEALAAHATSTRNSDRRRVSTVGASGQCIRKVFYIKNADDPIYAIPVTGRQTFDVKALKAAAIAAGVDVARIRDDR
jgi:hypothetical protein